MRLRIVSDGTVFGTDILDAETGEPVDLKVIGVDISLYVAETPTVTLTICGGFELDLSANVTGVEASHAD